MSEGVNKILLLGNLGADPELRVTQGGQAILKLRLATTETYLDSSNMWQERTEWHQVTMWGKCGESLSKLLRKGERIFVEGRISTTSYDKDGEKRYRTEVVATNIILNGRGEEKPREREDAAPPRRTARGAPPPRDDFGGPPDDSDLPF